MAGVVLQGFGMAGLLRLPLAAAEPSADFNGLLVVLGVLVALGAVGWLLLRKPPKRADPPSHLPRAAADERSADDQAGAGLDDAERVARRNAKALRMAARGGVKVGADGSTERRGAVGAGGVGEHSDANEAALRSMLAGMAAAQGQTTGPQAAAKGAAGKAAADDAETRARLNAGLSKTRKEGFVGMLGKLFAGKQIDESILDQVEEVLYRADLGVAATKALLEAVRKELSRGELGSADRVWASLETRARAILDDVGRKPLDIDAGHGPAVLMVVGVNGSGKTTTIGKLAHRYASEGRKVLIGAGDTFRAAAVDQLAVWCDRAGVDIHRGKEGADPASVCFAAVERAKAEGYDLVICDTAGRLHTNAGLMSELQKVHRVIGKAHGGAPHEVLLVLDATMGQNAVVQAKQFGEAMSVTAIAMTKLDGTAKGGVVLAIAETLKIPVKLIGVGEKMEDLRDFDANSFCAALFAREG